MISGQRYFLKLTPELAVRALDEIRRMPTRPSVGKLMIADPSKTPKIVSRRFLDESAKNIDDAIKMGAYAAMDKAYKSSPRGHRRSEEVRTCAVVVAPGFSDGLKWTFIPKDARLSTRRQRGRECEPGTCKDREILYWGSSSAIEESLLLLTHSLPRIRTSHPRRDDPRTRGARESG